MNTVELLKAVKEHGIKVVDAISETLTKGPSDPHRRLAKDMEKLGQPRMHTPAAPWAKALKVKAIIARQKARRELRKKRRLARGLDRNGHKITPRKAVGTKR